MGEIMIFVMRSVEFWIADLECSMYNVRCTMCDVGIQKTEDRRQNYFSRINVLAPWHISTSVHLHIGTLAHRHISTLAH